MIAMPVTSHAIEDPAHDVLRAFGDVELRQCAPYVVAEGVINGAA